MHIGSLLSRHATYRPDHLCLIFEDRRLTYKEFNAEVNRLANELLKAGLRKGEKFATILPNCLELMAAYWAAAKTGLVIVPCHPALTSGGTDIIAEELGYTPRNRRFHVCRNPGGDQK